MNKNNEEEYFFTEGKNRINELVWLLAPGNLTLDDAEKLSIKIYELLKDEWEK